MINSSSGQMTVAITENVFIHYGKERSKQVPSTVVNIQDKQYAAADGFLCTFSNGLWNLVAVVEAKTRWPPVTYESICNDPAYDRRLVMDEEKLNRCNFIAQELGVEFWSISIFDHEKTYLVQRIKDSFGNVKSDYYLKDVEVRKNMNTQETKVKSQAFISIETAKPYKYD